MVAKARGVLAGFSKRCDPSKPLEFEDRTVDGGRLHRLSIHAGRNVPFQAIVNGFARRTPFRQRRHSGSRHRYSS